MSRIDTIIIGGGETALKVASRLGPGRIAIIDDQGFAGGWTEMRRIIISMLQLSRSGLRFDEIWQQSLDDHLAQAQAKPRLQRFQALGLTTINGKARQLDKNAVMVNGEILKAKHIIVASGQRLRYRRLPGDGRVSRIEHIFSLKRLPSRSLLLNLNELTGAFAEVLLNLGSRVSILTEEGLVGTRAITSLVGRPMSTQALQRSIRVHYLSGPKPLSATAELVLDSGH